MKAEVDKQDITKFVNVLIGLKDLKTKVDYLDAGKLNTVPVDLKKKTSLAVSKEIVKTQNLITKCQRK